MIGSISYILNVAQLLYNVADFDFVMMWVSSGRKLNSLTEFIVLRKARCQGPGNEFLNLQRTEFGQADELAADEIAKGHLPGHGEHLQ